MKLAFPLTMLLALAPALSTAQPVRPPIASNPVVAIEGKVLKVQIAQGQGMPFLELASGDQTTRIYLGAMRYLMEQNFNPKAGTRITVQGYKMNSDVVAISVTIPAERRTLKLRDSNGFPLWRGGMRMHGKGASGRQRVPETVR
jgi:hypothetical protein